MKKTYSSPVVKELHMDTEQMVAESLAINSSVGGIIPPSHHTTPRGALHTERAPRMFTASFALITDTTVTFWY